MYPTYQIAVSLLLEDDGKILLGKRSSTRDFASDIWEVPAGRIETGETLDAAIAREAMEELGVEITSNKLLDAYQFMRADQPMLLLTYICQYTGVIKTSDEHQELRWVEPEEAIELFSFEKQKDTIKKYIQSI